MLHVFSALDRHFVLDVGSGALHQLDEMAAEVLAQHAEGRSDSSIIHSLSGKYPGGDVQECLEELSALCAHGQLDTPDIYEGISLAGDGAVKAMCLHVAHDCNLRCRYCFAETGEYRCGKRSMLTLPVGKRALEWLVAHAGKRRTLEVDFFGGEPLMNFSVVEELVRYGRTLGQLHDKEFLFTITTNALGLTPQIRDFINEEMDNVVLSIDGRREVHDRMRPTENGKGSYDLVLPKAQAFVKTRGDKKYYVRGTFSAYNLDFAEDVLALYEAGFQQLSVEPVVADPAEDYAIQPEMLPAFFAEYERLARICLEKWAAGEFFNFFHFMLDLSGGPCLKKRLTGCGAGNEYVAVTPQGDIYPCHQFVGREDYRMGSVMDDSFDAALQHRFQQNHVQNKPDCAKCWAKFFCSGGCAANALNHSGDIAKPNDMECQMQRKRLELALALYAIEKEEKENATAI